jgi:hypothetical protein
VSSESWIHKGQRVKKYKARDSRWGKGKVHMAVYVPRHRAYGMGCRELSDLAFILGGVDAGNVPKNKPVTCKLCRKKFGLDVTPAAHRGKRKVIIRRKKKT